MAATTVVAIALVVGLVAFWPRPPLPHPATLVIDKDGKVAWLEVDEDYRVRPATETVLEALGSLGDGEGGEEDAGDE